MWNGECKETEGLRRRRRKNLTCAAKSEKMRKRRRGKKVTCEAQI